MPLRNSHEEADGGDGPRDERQDHAQAANDNVIGCAGEAGAHIQVEEVLQVKDVVLDAVLRELEKR